MPLSCDCGLDDLDVAWYYWPPNDYSIMPQRRARKRCVSCDELIDHGATVAEFHRSRFANGDYEESRFGEGDPEAVTLASVYLCERCADLYFSLDDLGFCVSPYEDQRELVREYAAMQRQGAGYE